MPTRTKVTLLGSCQVAPPPSAVAEMSHNLTFCDMKFIGCIPNQRIILYNHPVSKTYFIDIIVPTLKNSLSHALKYFPSLAGKCIIPTDSKQPEIRYSEGDYISFVIAESNILDIDYLGSDQARLCSEFYPCLPQLSPELPESPESMDSCGAIIFPILAVQVTLFPEAGYCIGVEYLHVAGDGCAMYAFMKMWATISKFGEYEASIGDELLPVYDRVVIEDHTNELDDLCWNRWRKTLAGKGIAWMNTLKLDPDRVRSTFVISVDDVQTLKNYYASNQISAQEHPSTFTVICGYIWTCMVKVNNVTMDDTNVDETEYLSCPLDFRGRVEPPVPKNYFGNCIVQCEASAKNGDLLGAEGFVIAVERIAEAIKRRCQGVFEGLEKLFDEYAEMNSEKTLWIAGSHRLDYYEMDFGWGNPSKVEIISTDSNGAIHFGACRDGSPVPEIGVSLPKEKMDVFSEIFREGLACV